MDVSKNRGPPKWMVYNGKPYWEVLHCARCAHSPKQSVRDIMENPIKMDDLGAP